MKEKVYKSMKSMGAVKAADVAEITGIGKEDVNKVIKELIKEGKVDSPKRCFYQAK